MTPAVEVRDLVKKYPKATGNAVDGVSFAVRPGEVFGLLGPNGAGKTTIVGILTTRVLLTGGTALVGGVDVARDPVGARREVAVVPQHINLDRSLNARQNLVFHASYHGLARAERNRLADELLSRMGLEDKAKAHIESLSGGQAQRLMIARALIHRPEVLFLDEPSTGLDPQARLFVHDRIRDLRAEGVTVVLTTHDMDEAQKLSDRVGVVDHGRLLTLDTPDALISALPGTGAVDATLGPNGHDEQRLSALLSDVDGVEGVEPITDAAGSGDERQLRLRLYVAGEPASLLGPITSVLHEREVPVRGLALGSATLEDVFIDLTGRELR